MRGSGKIPKYTDSERLMTHKTDYLLTVEDEESVSMDFQVCRPQNCRVPCHLKRHGIKERRLTGGCLDCHQIPCGTALSGHVTSGTTYTADDQVPG